MINTNTNIGIYPGGGVHLGTSSYEKKRVPRARGFILDNIF